MTKVIAILGGAFDPVHSDHVALGRLAIEHELAQEVWYVPSPDRWDKKLFATADQRMAMLHLALAGQPQLVASDLEIRMGEFRGSYHFLRHLANEYVQYDFRLLIGADSYTSIPHWRDPLHFYGTEFNGTQLLKEFPLIIFARQGVEFPDLTAHIEQGYLPFSSLSVAQTFEGVHASSAIRNHLWHGLETPAGLHPDVLRFIQDHGLYKHL